MPAIYSPEMAMAGFGMLGDIVPAINYVARLDGTQSYLLSDNRTLSGDFEVSFDVLIDGVPPFILTGGDGSSNAGGILFNDGKFLFRDVDGVTRETQSIFSSSGDTEYSVRMVVESSVITVFINGVPQTLTGDTSNFTGIYLRYLVTRNGLYSRYRLEGYIKNFKVVESGVTTIEIPLTNKAQGATQLATVGNVNATMVGYTPDVWEVDTQ